MEKVIESLDLTSKGVWFPIAVGIVLSLFMIFMPKRISWREIFFLFGVIGYMTWMIDMTVAKTLDIFDLGNPDIEGLGDVMTYGVIPSALAVIFLNFLKQDKRWLYAILFTILSFLFEWGMVKVGYMKLKGWNTWWSIPVYLGMYGFVLPWILSLLRGEAASEEGPRESSPHKESWLGKRIKAK